MQNPWIGGAAEPQQAEESENSLKIGYCTWNALDCPELNMCSLCNHDGTSM